MLTYKNMLSFVDVKSGSKATLKIIAKGYGFLSCQNCPSAFFSVFFH